MTVRLESFWVAVEPRRLELRVYFDNDRRYAFGVPDKATPAQLAAVLMQVIDVLSHDPELKDGKGTEG